MKDRTAGPMWWAGFPMLVTASAFEAAALVPFRYLATEDGPTNVASAHIIANYPGPYRTYFSLDFFPKFDMLWQLLLSVAVRVMPALVAERVLVVALVIGLPIAGWYGLRGVRYDAGPIAFLLLPLSIGYYPHAGYHSFCLGLILFFVTIGWWLRHREGGVGPALVLAGLFVVTYLAHVVAAAMTIGLIFVVLAWEMITADRRRAARQLAFVVAAAVPVALLTGLYLATRSAGTGTTHLALSELVKALLSWRTAVVSMDRREGVLSVLLAVTVIGLALHTLVRVAPRRLREPGHAWLAASVAAVAVYFVAPDKIGDGGGISARILLFVVFAVLLWLAAFPHARWFTAAIVGVALVATAGLTLLHVPKYVAFDRDLREYASAGDHVPRGATVLPVNLVLPADAVSGLASSTQTRPVIQAAGYLVAERNVVDLSHFNGQFGYFITQFRPEVDPFRFIGHGKNWLDDSTPDVDLIGYEGATQGRGRIDYVIVWGEAQAPAEVTSSPEVQLLRAQLAQAYDLVYTSPRGHLTLYQHRNG